MTQHPPVPREALDEDALIDSLLELRARPAPGDPSSLGCGVSIAAIIVLVFMPVLTRAVDLPGAFFFWLGVALFVVALVGGVVGILGGGFTRGALIGEVEDAINELAAEYPDLAPTRLRHLAVLILNGSVVSYGPTSSMAFDPHEVSVTLGPATDYLRAVERTLLKSESIYPCFTADGESGQAGEEEVVNRPD